LPYLTDSESQFELKISAVLIQVCLVCFVQSWNYWPKKNTIFIFSFFPVVEWCFEILKSGRRMKYGLDNRVRAEFDLNTGVLNGKNALFFLLNLFGMFLLLWVAGEGEGWGSLGKTVHGLSWSAASLVCAVISWRKLSQNVLSDYSKRPSNFLSVSMVISLVLTVFTPAFFALSSGNESTSIFDMILMLGVGVVTTYGFYSGMVAVILTRKRSHFLLFCTLTLAVVLFSFGIWTDGLTLAAFVGIIFAFFGAVVIYINETRKDETIDYSREVPLIG